MGYARMYAMNITIEDAQRDVRTTFMGGFAGQLVTSLIWFASAALATWYSSKAGIVVLLVACTFIYPLTQLTLRIMGHANALPKGHPMNYLAMQVAFTIPVAIPVVAAAAMHRTNLFYPGIMVILGAHYMPFIFLYGMRQFAVLAALLIGGGWGIGWYFVQSPFSLGGWYTAVVLLAFAFILRQAALRREAPSS